MKIGFYCYLIADILTEVLQKYSLSGPLQNIPFMLLPLNLVGYHGTEKNSRINSLEAVWGIKLKLCRIVSNISLYKSIVLLPLLEHFGCYGNLKFPLTYRGLTVGKVKMEIYCYLIDKLLIYLYMAQMPVKCIGVGNRVLSQHIKFSKDFCSSMLKAHITI